eukprot:3715820-Pleurochrysis_carterae.AAC.2
MQTTSRVHADNVKSAKRVRRRVWRTSAALMAQTSSSAKSAADSLVTHARARARACARVALKGIDTYHM